MALIPSASFPGAIDTSDATGYPLGKAKNDSAPGANDGTPLVAPLVNDIWGFQQALLAAAGITPSGSPDAANSSQYLEAIRAVAKALTRYVPSTVSAATLTTGSADHMKYFTLTNAGATTVTVSAPAAPYGDCVTFEKGASAGNITFVGASGVTISVAAGASLTVTGSGKVATLISKGANSWKLIV